MTRSEILAELLKLDPEERLQIVEDVWSTLDDDEGFELTDEEAAELQRRMDELEADPSIGIPWEEVRARLRKVVG